MEDGGGWRGARPERELTAYRKHGKATSVRAVRYAVCLLTLALSQAAAAESWPPPEGKSVDRERTFALPTRAPEPCISAKVDGVSFLMPVDELKRLADADRGARNDEADADAFARRARRVLALETAEKDQYGCAVLVKPLRSDPYLVLHLLEAGKAALVLAETGKLSPQVIIRYVGKCRDHGEIFVYLPEGRRQIMALQWWIA